MDPVVKLNKILYWSLPGQGHWFLIKGTKRKKYQIELNTFEEYLQRRGKPCISHPCSNR